MVLQVFFFAEFSVNQLVYSTYCIHLMILLSLSGFQIVFMGLFNFDGFYQGVLKPQNSSAKTENQRKNQSKKS